VVCALALGLLIRSGMKKQNREKKSLNLTRERVRDLLPDQLPNVVGGVSGEGQQCSNKTNYNTCVASALC
jgi:hypothetical protein